MNDTATTEIYTLSLHDALDGRRIIRSEEHTSELQSHSHLVCRLLLAKKTMPSPPSATTASTPSSIAVRLSYLAFSMSLFFFNDTATPEIYTFPYTTLFRSTASRVPSPRSRARASPSPPSPTSPRATSRSEEHTSELQSHSHLVCRLLLE